MLKIQFHRAGVHHHKLGEQVAAQGDCIITLLRGDELGSGYLPVFFVEPVHIIARLIVGELQGECHFIIQLGHALCTRCVAAFIEAHLRHIHLESGTQHIQIGFLRAQRGLLFLCQILAAGLIDIHEGSFAVGIQAIHAGIQRLAVRQDSAQSISIIGVAAHDLQIAILQQSCVRLHIEEEAARRAPKGKPIKNILLAFAYMAIFTQDNGCIAQQAIEYQLVDRTVDRYDRVLPARKPAGANRCIDIHVSKHAAGLEGIVAATDIHGPIISVDLKLCRDRAISVQRQIHVDMVRLVRRAAPKISHGEAFQLRFHGIRSILFRIQLYADPPCLKIRSNGAIQANMRNVLPANGNSLHRKTGSFQQHAVIYDLNGCRVNRILFELDDRQIELHLSQIPADVQAIQVNLVFAVLLAVGNRSRNEHIPQIGSIFPLSEGGPNQVIHATMNDHKRLRGIIPIQTAPEQQPGHVAGIAQLAGIHLDDVIHAIHHRCVSDDRNIRVFVV